MQRKKACDYPQELLDLFDRYVHGELDRRGFLEAAKKFAVGGVTATAIWESLRPNYAWAQQVPRNHFRELANVGGRDSKCSCCIFRVTPRLVQRSRPKPLQQRYLCIGKKRNVGIRDYEILFLIKSVDSLSRRLSFLL